MEKAAAEKYNTNTAETHNTNTIEKFNTNTAEIYNQNTTQYFRSCCGIEFVTKAIQLQCDMISKIILIPCKNSTEIIRGKDVINPLGILQCSVWARVEGRAVRILPRQPLDPASTQLPGTVEGGGALGRLSWMRGGCGCFWDGVIPVVGKATTTCIFMH